MKLKINKACDLSSISVLPPSARRSSAIRNGSEPSVFGKSQGSQLRSQTSQLSFSQGVSSQHGMFSQLSQNSLEEILTNEQASSQSKKEHIIQTMYVSQEIKNSHSGVSSEMHKRIGSEEKENSEKKMPCLPVVGYSRDESQMVLSRPSTNQFTKWNSTTSSDHRSQKNEELEHRIWSMENSLNRFAMILDSVQTDILQANKGTKEVLMEMEGIRQKLTAYDNILQQMNKGQDNIKSNLIEGFKSISDHVSHDQFQEKLKEISSSISSLKGQMDVHLPVLKPELCKAIAQQMQAIACSLKITQQKHLTSLVTPNAIAYSLKMPEKKHLTPVFVSPDEIRRRATPKQIPPLKKQYSANCPAFRTNQSHMISRSPVRPEVCEKTNLIPEVEVGSWTSVKTEQATIKYARRNNMQKQKRPSPIELEKEWRIPIESDEEINGGFSCLFEEKETGNYLTAEVKDETDRILRRARRRKRKSRNIIILN